jgi:hypothetical protein
MTLQFVGHPSTLSDPIRSSPTQMTYPRRRRNTGQLKFTQEIVILCHGALSLKDLDRHNSLIVLGECQNETA